ncbi:MAG: hypothetical protein LKJ90_05620 [Faecalibacterium sp.]|jgi:hypothetical protein|nr:hypothetical protein [Faecalibacterium sp.]
MPYHTRKKKSAAGPLLVILLCIAGVGFSWWSMDGTADAESRGTAVAKHEQPQHTVSAAASLAESAPQESCYAQLKASILAQDASVFLAGASKQDFQAAYAQVVDDPALFGVNGCNYTTTSLGVKVDWVWNCDDFPARLAAAEAAANDILAGMDQSASDYNKVLYLHDWLCRNVSYVSSEDATDQTIYGALVARQAVCSGYCNAFRYLLAKLGIEAGIVKGTAGGQSHAWNSVTLGDELYYCDVTWDDQEGDGGNYISYNWFCVTSEEMRRQHTPNEDARMPDTAATACNYYIYNGYQMDSWSEARLVEILSTQAAGQTLTVRCADDATYQQMEDVLFGQNEVIRILREAGVSATSLRYTEEPEMRTVTFLLA